MKKWVLEAMNKRIKKAYKQVLGDTYEYKGDREYTKL